MLHQHTVTRFSFFFAIAALLSPCIALASITYQWVPNAGSGGNGYIRFDETFLAGADDGSNYVYTDEQNFITLFGNPPVVEIFFAFDNGFSIDTAVGFSTASSIQSDLSNTQFQANNGVITGLTGDFVFDYTTIRLVDNSYNGVVVQPILCITLPCPQGSLQVNFIGQLSAERNTGKFQYTPSVPVPAALPLMLSGLGILGFMCKRRHC